MLSFKKYVVRKKETDLKEKKRSLLQQCVELGPNPVNSLYTSMSVTGGRR